MRYRQQSEEIDQFPLQIIVEMCHFPFASSGEGTMWKQIGRITSVNVSSVSLWVSASASTQPDRKQMVRQGLSPSGTALLTSSPVRHSRPLRLIVVSRRAIDDKHGTSVSQSVRASGVER